MGDSRRIGLSARATDVEIVDKLNHEVNAALADPTIRGRLAEPRRTVLLAGSPADFGKHIADETEKWSKVSSLPASNRIDPTKTYDLAVRRLRHRHDRCGSLNRQCGSRTAYRNVRV